MRSTLALPLLSALAALATAQDATIADKTKGLDARPGLFVSYVDAKQGKAYLKFPAADAKSGHSAEFLYVESLATGLGANDLGLDRTQFGRTYVVRVRPIGQKVLFEVPNLNFRATTPSGDERRAVEQGFATSVFWAGTIAARDTDGSYLVDVTDLLLKDVHGVTQSLERQGGFSLDKDRSTLLPENCKAFPDNLEFEALLTFKSSKPGAAIGDHAPDPESITVSQRHSFVRLPDSGYAPRKFDPRSGSFAISYLDFAAPLDEPLLKLFICRHRLEKTDPSAAVSTVKEPIVYFVDRGVPEPIRTALIDGGNYWKSSFEKAGFKDAFRVELMPEGMDPLDVRNNVIQWMNRSTRGWAYGQSVVDPRTGEILKGAVNLDSQRARQDLMIFEALVGVDRTGKGGPNDPMAAVLARIRQLSAHEIGHTLGFQHNFAASFGSGSVMDYPAPNIAFGPKDEIDLSRAYAPGVGPWDDYLVRYAYSQFSPGTLEPFGLQQIVDEGLAQGLVFLADEDASESGGASPITNRWDNGMDPVAMLRQALKVREVAMAGFGERNLRPGQPLGNLEIVFGPLYFFHRYDVDSVAKMIGGVHYRHRVRGDAQPAATPVAPSRQREALEILMDCLEPHVLAVPKPITDLMGQKPNGYPRGNERFPGKTPFAFDSISAAAAAADMVLARLLDPGRCSRVVELSSRSRDAMTFDEVLDALVPPGGLQVQGAGNSITANDLEIYWAVQHAKASRLMDLVVSDAASTGVKSRAATALKRLAALVGTKHSSQGMFLAAEIARFLERPLQETRRITSPQPAMPGAPIGDCGWHQAIPLP